MSKLSDRDWGSTIGPILEDAWWEARKRLLLLGREQSDVDRYAQMDPDHMGDPAQLVDIHMHQFFDARLKQAVPGILVFGEEAPMRQVLLNAHSFPFVAFVDPIDGSAAAWSLPGGWGQVIVIQKFINTQADGTPVMQLLFIGVIDAEGGTTTFDFTTDRLEIDTLGQGFEGGESRDRDPLTYAGGCFEVTGLPTVLIGGYKPKSDWWLPFKTVREKLLSHPTLNKAQVFNIAGAPAARKVIQNADNVVIQLNNSTLWDGSAALLIAAADGTVIRRGDTEPCSFDEILSWWSKPAYQLKKREIEPCRQVPGFIAGMRPDRVRDVAELCQGL